MTSASLYYQQNLSHALADAQRYDALLSQVGPIISVLETKGKDGTLPMLQLPARTDDLAEIEALAAQITTQFKTLVVLGTGGSSLGGQALVALRQGVFPDVMRPRVVFVDNVDPQTMQQAVESLELDSTMFLVISKSGGTVETLTQMLVMVEAVRAWVDEPAALARHFTAIVMPGDNPLRRIASGLGIRVLDHDPKLGGRFSVFSSVGLLPAAVAGLNIRRLRDGAQSVITRTFATPTACEAAQGAAMQVAHMQAGRTISVMMPYADRLELFAEWYQQVWAESLGKEGKGSTAVRAIGAVDQHSQLQLYLDGPKDKHITLLLTGAAGEGPQIDGAWLKDSGLALLRGKTVGDVMDALQRGTEQTFIDHGCPLRVMHVPVMEEEALGALMMHFMLETLIAAGLLGVDAFDQPAVEHGKVLAREYLGAAREHKAG